MSPDGRMVRPERPCGLSLRVCIVYAVLGLLWVVGGDVMVRVIWPGELNDFAETVKGVLYVIVSALVIWLLISRGERRLRDRESRYRILVESAQEGIWEFDTETRTVFVNQHMADMLGYTPQEILGRSLFEFCDEEWAKVGRERIARRLEGQSEQHEFPFLRRDGSPLWMRVAGNPLRDSAGNVTGIMGVITDITAEREERQEQDRLTQGLQQVVAITDELIQLRDVDDLCRRAIELARERLGVERCSIFLVEGEEIRGTFGTSFEGLLTDDRVIRIPMTDGWREVLRPHAPDRPGWEVQHGPLRAWDGTEAVEREEGWIAVTPICAREGPMGLFYNDTAITHAELDTVQQTLLVVLAAALGEMILRTRVEASLTRSEALYRQAITNARGVPYLRDYTSGAYAVVGEGMEALTGIPAAEFTPQRFRAIVQEWVVTDPEGPPDWEEYARTFLEGDAECYQADIRVLTPQGEEKWLSDRSVAIHDEQTGQLLSSLGILQDITERRRIEDDLRSERDFSAGILSSMPTYFVAVSMERNIIAANPALLQATGYTLAEVVGQPFLATFVPEEAQATFIAGMRAFGARQEMVRLECPIQGKDGQRRLVDWYGSPIFDAEGNVAYVFGIGVDVTAQRAMEEELRLSHEYLGVAQRAAKAGLWDWDVPAEQLTWSAEFRALFGIAPDAPASFDTWTATLHPDDVEAAVARLNDAIEQRVPLYNEYRIVLPDGQVKWIGAWGDTDYDEAGNPLRMAGICSDITQIKQAEQALRESEERFRRLYEQSPAPYHALDEQGNILEVNDAWLQALGYEREEVIGRWLGDLLVGEISEVWRERYAEFIQAGQPHTTTRGLRRKDGQVIRAAFVARISHDAGGRHLRTHGVWTDITEREQAEEALRESEERFRRMVSTIREAVFTLDAEGVLTYVNDAFCEGIGLSREEAIGLPVEALLAPEGIETRKPYWDLLRQGIPVNYEVTARHSTGEVIHALISSTPIMGPNGEFQGTLAASTNITDRVRAEEALRESRDLLSATGQIAKIGGWQWDVVRQTMKWTDETYRIHGVEPGALAEGPDEHITQSLSCYDPGDREIVEEAFRRCAEDGTPYSLEFPFTTFDGRRIWIQTMARAVEEDGRIVRVTGNIWDITERKQAEEAARESDARFRRVVETMREGVTAVDTNRCYAYANDRFCEILRRSREEIIGHPIEEFLSPASRGQLDAEWRQRKQGQMGSYHVEWQLPGGEIGHSLVASTPLYDENGEFQGSFAITTDITDLKQAEEALRESEGLLSAIVETATDSIFVKDASLRYIRANPAMAALFGITVEDILGKTDRDLFGPEAEMHFEEVDRRVLMGETIAEFPSKSVRGEMRHFHTIKAPLRDAQGQIVGLCGIARDITDRVRAEEALRDREADLRLAQELAHVGSWTEELPGHDYTWSDELYHIVGRDPSQGIPNADEFVALIHPDDLAGWTRLVEETTREGRGYEAELSIVRPDGAVRRILAMSELETDPDGHPTRRWGTFQDITERKQAEDALRESEADLRQAQEMAHVGSWTQDPATGENHWSEEMYRIHGLDPEDEPLSLEEFGGLIHPEDWPAVEAATIRVMTEGVGYELEVRVLRPDGEMRYTLGRGEAVWGPDGKVELVRGTVQDITDRKRAEDEVRESRARYRSLVETTSDWVWEVDADAVYTYASPKVRDLLGFEPEDILGKTPFDMMPPDEATRVAEIFGPIASRREAFAALENTCRHADGRLVVVETSGVPIFNDAGVFLGYRGMDRDITGRKRAEAEVRAGLERYRSLYESLPGGVIVVDGSQSIREANPVARALLGIRPLDVEAGVKLPAVWRAIREDGTPLPVDAYPGAATLSTGEAVQGMVVGLYGPSRSAVTWVSVNAEPFRDRETGAVLAAVTSFVDITDRRQAEEALRESAERFESLFENMHEGVALYELLRDAEGNLVDYRVMGVNASFERITRNTRARMIGRLGTEIHSTPDRLNLERYAQVAETREAWVEEIYSPDLDRALAFSVVPWMEAGVALIVSDVTERYRATEALRTRSEDLQAIPGIADELMSCPDLDSMFRRAVEFARERLRVERCALYLVEGDTARGVYGTDMQGETCDERHNSFYLGENWHERLFATRESLWDVVEMPVENAEGAPVTWNAYTLIPSVDGPLGLFYTDSRISDAPLDPSQQEVLCVYCSLLGSLIAWRQALDRAQESAEQFRSLYENMGEGVVLCDLLRDDQRQPVDYRVVSANPRFHQLMGIAHVDISGQMGSALHGNLAVPSLDELARVVDTDGSWEREVYIASLDRHLTFSIRPWMGTGFAAIVSDITDRWQAEWRQQLMAQVLGTLNRGVDIPQIEEMLEIIQVQTGLHAVGLRAFREHDYPYIASRGFPEGLLDLEASLCARDSAGQLVVDADGDPILECMCGVVLRGETDPALPFYTAAGSFWTNQSSDILQLLDRYGVQGSWRGRCVTQGYESLALIPVRSAGRPIGLLHLADQRKGQLNETLLRFYEELAASIGVALQRRLDEAALRDARDDLEVRVEERTAELQASHAEMEAFNYTVSHDLRAPLRAMQGFAEALGEDYADLLDDFGKDCISRIIGGTRRMDELIQDLLAYSRLTRVELDMGAVDITQLVQGVLQTAAAIVKDRGATITVQQDMPLVVANDTVLSQIIGNLITNAVKFTAPETPPHVEVTAEDLGDRVRIWISDNGIGIAPEHHERIFRVFERLHGVETYPGTGIGLAIVQKGTMRMGGRCGVETTPGVGSRFWVEFPKAGPIA